MMELGGFILTLVAVFAAAAYEHWVLVGGLIAVFYVYILWRIYD